MEKLDLPVVEKKTPIAKDNKQEMHKLRNDFNIFLAKLSNKETKHVALNELKKIIESNINSDALKVFLSSLSNYDKTLTSLAKEGQIEILTVIIEKYKELDNSLQKVCNIIYKTLNDSSLQVHIACSNALITLYTYCLSNRTKEQIKTFLYNPLEEIILTNPNKLAQSGAAKSIHVLILEFCRHKDLMKYLLPSFIDLFNVSIMFIIEIAY